jgi:hypothetical protein
MPILSATRFACAQDDLFWPATLIPWPDTPAYSFHFGKPDKSAAAANFDRHFFFDNGADFKKAFVPTLIPLQDGNLVDLADRRVHYYRLFPLRSVPGKSAIIWCRG